MVHHTVLSFHKYPAHQIYLWQMAIGTESPSLGSVLTVNFPYLYQALHLQILAGKEILTWYKALFMTCCRLHHKYNFQCSGLHSLYHVTKPESERRSYFSIMMHTFDLIPLLLKTCCSEGKEKPENSRHLFILFD